jgi:hypothetical protein
MVIKEKEKGSGLVEVVGTGVVAGAATAHVAGTLLAREQVKNLAAELVQTAFETAKNFEHSNPKPSYRFGNGMLWLHQLDLAKWAARRDEAIKLATAAIDAKAVGYTNPLTRPFVVFSNASIPAKIGMGAITAISALGAAWAINRWRNSGSEKTYADRLENERAAASVPER